MDKKTSPIYMVSIKDPFQNKSTHRLKVNGWKKIFRANGNKKAGRKILVSEKNRLLNKGHKKRQGGSLHNSKGIDLTRGM